MEIYFFEQSFQDSKLSFSEWCKKAAVEWARIKRSKHYHDGVPCQTFHQREQDAKHPEIAP